MKIKERYVKERCELLKEINEEEKIQSPYVVEGNMQRTSRELPNITTTVKVMGKKIGKKRAIQNVPKGHRHMSQKVAQEKWQKKKYQGNQAKLVICPTIQYFTHKRQKNLKQLLISHSNSKKPLNKYLHAGNNFQNSLVGVLLRCQNYEIALVADLECSIRGKFQHQIWTFLYSCVQKILSKAKE